MLTIIREIGQIKNKRHFLCKCECGRNKEIALIRLTTGKTKSCGCIKKFNSITHGMCHHPLYNVWNAMKQRCSNPNQRAYIRYGARGIKVCVEWLSFETFKDWALTNGYKEGLTIERIDNDGDYKSTNCEFVSKIRQANNRTNNHFINYQGKRMTLSDWGRQIDINPLAILKRLNRGWNIEKALSAPLMKNQFR